MYVAERNARRQWDGAPPARSALRPTAHDPRTVNTPEVARHLADPEPFPADVAEFLLEFSIGIHRHAMYPANHPSLKPATAAILGRLQTALQTRADLRLGVLRDRFVCDDRETDPRHPVISELSERLHDHELAALAFRPGVEAPELRELLAFLAPEVERGGAPLGSLPRDQRPSWPHISLEPLHYDELALDDADAGDWEDRARELWGSLVRSAMGEAADPASDDVARELAAAVAESTDDPLQLRLVAGYLSPLVESLVNVQDGRMAGVREGLSEFLSSLDPEARAGLLRTGGDAAWRRDLLGAASRSLDVDALLDLLQAAATASEQTISTSMTRLLTKLATHQRQDDPGSRRRADGALRENVRSLLRDWTLDDPNPDAYSGVLDSLARAAPAADTESPDDDVPVALRILAMTVELDVWTRRSAEALRTAVDGGRLAEIYVLVDEGGAGPGADRILETLRRPAWIRRVVAPDDLPEAALGRLAREAGVAAVPPLMDGLVAGRTREARRVIFDTLARYGDAVIPEVEARLPSPYWFVNRNLMNLLAVVPGPSSVDPLAYLAHDDPRVRRAALPVALKVPGLVEAALIRAVSDRDERLTQLALLRVRQHPHPDVLSAVVERVVLAGRSPELRILAIRALRGHRSPVVREGLLDVVVRGLRAPPEHAHLGAAIAAAGLEALLASWPLAPDVAALVAEARESPHAAVRKAAGGEA